MTEDRVRRSSRRPKNSLRAFRVGSGLPTVTHMMDEVQDMIDVLLGRVDPPIDAGVLTMMEVADAYYARASELTILILEGERNGHILPKSGHYKFRTGELRNFMEIAKRASELGSRRLTEKQVELLQERHGRENV